MAEITEKSIQILLYLFRRSSSHQMIVPNVKIDDYEADLLSLTRAGFLHEHEIKLTKADYKADFLKIDKHRRLKQGNPFVAKWSNVRFTVPNYFWYVAPRGIIETVPEYAGLIEIKTYEKTLGWPTIIKSAPKIHKEKLSAETQFRILNNFAHRHWQKIGE